MNYLSVGSDAKTVKGEKQGYLTGILYLAPAQEASPKTLCPFSTAGCRAVCLYAAGRGAMKSVRDARVRKTKEFLADPKKFVGLIIEDIELLIAQAEKKGMIPAVRLNGTTDIEWEKYGIMEKFPNLQFYDYTKWPAGRRMSIPKNYHLTYSFSEKPNAALQSVGWKMRGFNTAVVFAGRLPSSWRVGDETYERPVIDGDLSDLRFLDPKGVIVGLKTKGKARGVVDAGTGFVQLGKAA
jgi:hypothetical protein